MVDILSGGWALSLFVVLTIAGPWLLVMLNTAITLETQGYWIPPVSPDGLVELITKTYLYEFTQTSGMAALAAVVMWAILLGVLVVRIRSPKNQAFTLLIISIVVPFLLTLIASIPPLMPKLVDRYLTPSLLMLWMIVPIIVYFYFSGWKRTVIQGVCVVLYGFCVIIGYQNVVNYNKALPIDGSTVLFTRVVTEIDHRDAVIIAPNTYVAAPISRYAPVMVMAPHGDVDIVSRVFIDTEPAVITVIESLRDAEQTANKWWMLYYEDHQPDVPEDWVQLEQRTYRDGLGLYAIRATLYTR